MRQRIRDCAAAGLLLSALTAAQAATYNTVLTGAKEAPPNASPAIGTSVITFDQATHVLEITVTFSGLVGETLASHIHCCTTVPGDGIAGVMTEPPSFNGFPLGVRSGVYTHTYDTSLPTSWHQAFLSDFGGSTAFAEAAFDAGLKSGRAYLNIHTSTYPPGEIRGFFAPVTAAAIPEPVSATLLGLGLPAILLMAHRRRKSEKFTPA